MVVLGYPITGTTVTIDGAGGTGATATVVIDVFIIGDVITWSGGGNALVKFVGGDNKYLVIASNGGEDWLNPINGQLITSGAINATVNSNTISATINNDADPDNLPPPPGSLRESIGQDIEYVLREYEIENEDEAWATAAEILYHTRTTINRGDFTLPYYPYYRITGTVNSVTNTIGSTIDNVITDNSRTFVNHGIFIGDVITNTTPNLPPKTITTGKITAISGNTITTNINWDVMDTYKIFVMVRVGHTYTNRCSASACRRKNDCHQNHL